MPLTKGDKLIIIGAVVLALAVVAGLAAWRKPHLFSGGKPAPEMTSRDFTVPAPAPPGDPAAVAPAPPAPRARARANTPATTARPTRPAAAQGAQRFSHTPPR